MADSLLPDVANAVASGVVTALAERGSIAARKLVELVRDKLRPATASSDADPGADLDVTSWPTPELLHAFELYAQRDVAWVALVRSAWDELAPDGAIEGGVAKNSVSGNVIGNVVQARDVHGGISLG